MAWENKDMFELDYPSEKFCAAIYALAGNVPLRERILAAYMSFHTIGPEHFKNHPELLNDYEEIMADLTAKKEGFSGEGAVPATLRQMTDEEAARTAEQIIDFCFSIERARREIVRNKAS
jgi:hypothetical protein